MTDVPALTLPIVLMVLFAALLHAAWNVAVKGGKDPAAELAGLTLGASFLAIPLLLLVPVPPAGAWPYLFASTVIHIGYFTSLAASYRHADLVVAYPLMRGSAPLLVAIIGALTLSEWPSLGTWLGIALISGGVLSLAFARGRRATSGRGTVFALLNAIMIAAYTLVDAVGARVGNQAVAYVAWMFFLQGLPFAAVMVWWRGPSFLGYVRRRWRVGLAAGACSGAAYGIAVWAMTKAPVGAVAALRETSVIFALVLGSLFLGERLTLQRWLGVIAVLAGAVVMRA